MSTLVERALAFPARTRKARMFNAEELDLCLGWLRGEITRRQAMVALKLPSSQSFYIWAAQMSRELVVRKRLVEPTS